MDPQRYTVIPMHPSDAYRAGQVNPRTLVNRSTRDEGRLSVALAELLTGHATTGEDFSIWLERQYGAALVPSAPSTTSPAWARPSPL